MSQKKVDYYKEQKANRKNIIKKEKRMVRLEKLIVGLVCLVLVCWVGFSVYSKATSNSSEEVVDTELNTTALDEYIYGLSTDTAE